MEKSSFTVTYRDGSGIPCPVSVDKEHGKVHVQIRGIWWTMSSTTKKVFAANHEQGHYWGQVVNTTGGKEIRFAHNGHVYAASHPITAFARMLDGEGL